MGGIECSDIAEMALGEGSGDAGIAEMAPGEGSGDAAIAVRLVSGVGTGCGIRFGLTLETRRPSCDLVKGLPSFHFVNRSSAHESSVVILNSRNSCRSWLSRRSGSGLLSADGACSLKEGVGAYSIAGGIVSRDGATEARLPLRVLRASRSSSSRPIKLCLR